RRRADRRAEDVVRVRDVRDPVADRLGDRLLQRPRARLDRDDARPEQVHPLHVGLLAADVLGAHVDDALDPQPRAHGRRRDAVLEAAARHRAAPTAGAGAGTVEPTAAANARSFSGSFTPGRASVPLAVSTAYGCVASIAAATLSGESPPLSTNGTSVRRWRT